MPKDLGDIDVLLIDPLSHRIQVTECKDLALARTPDELAHQLQALLPKDKHDRDAATVRHERRVAWVRDHGEEILRHFGLEWSAQWDVDGSFVVDEPLFVPHLRGMALRVVALEELYAKVN
ncbi:MAG TPA: hypothetical protein VMO47_09350 [Rhodothermales bacterium]|nr:hypothetical protein [Rhodothermales bacterium]